MRQTVVLFFLLSPSHIPLVAAQPSVQQGHRSRVLSAAEDEVSGFRKGYLAQRSHSVGKAISSVGRKGGQCMGSTCVFACHTPACPSSLGVLVPNSLSQRPSLAVYPHFPIPFP